MRPVDAVLQKLKKKQNVVLLSTQGSEGWHHPTEFYRYTYNHQATTTTTTTIVLSFGQRNQQLYHG